MSLRKVAFASAGGSLLLIGAVLLVSFNPASLSGDVELLETTDGKAVQTQSLYKEGEPVSVSILRGDVASQECERGC